jgi:hypothetical protein
MPTETEDPVNWLKIRRRIFQLGLIALAISIATLIGSYVRPVHSTDYMQQFYEARPWLLWGTGSAFVGFLLSFFGKRYARLAAVAGGLPLTAFWVLLGEASL